MGMFHGMSHQQQWAFNKGEWMDINVNMVSLGYPNHAIERHFVLKYMSTIELIMGVETLV
jgi:hypothetical protein